MPLENSASVTGTEPSPVRKQNWYRKYHWEAYLFILPAAIIYFYFLLRPIGMSVWISLFEWDGITPATWIGLGHYRTLLGDRDIWLAFSHSFIFIIFYAAIPIILSLGIVAIVSRFKIRGLAAFRAILFIPYVLSTVVVAIAWRWIYSDKGSINHLISAITRDEATKSWLGDFHTALPAVGLIGTWVMFGLSFILFISGLQAIPIDLYEAARLDGAGFFQEFFAVTLPGLRSEIQVAAILMITAALRNFDIVWNTTSGGPGNATSVPSYFIYREAFLTHHVGRASAISVILTLLIFLIVGLIMWVTTEHDNNTKPKASKANAKISR